MKARRRLAQQCSAMCLKTRPEQPMLGEASWELSRQRQPAEQAAPDASDGRSSARRLEQRRGSRWAETQPPRVRNEMNWGAEQKVVDAKVKVEDLVAKGGLEKLKYPVDEGDVDDSEVLLDEGGAKTCELGEMIAEGLRDQMAREVQRAGDRGH
mmetsp:Transcript_154554/g.495476  ORF Transcript_154554/g.495476 Transcript_154554/m.495476 type:complete len:154 (+) Transcript_154554:962-1423(+)